MAAITDLTVPTAGDSPSFLTSAPSKVIKHHDIVLEIEGVSVRVDLISMNRSFLVAINDARSPGGFRDCNKNLNGLSLSISGISTCLINSETSESSNTLALRLSKKFNNNDPVYVANNIMPSRDIDLDGFTAKLYMKIFQFVGNVLAKERAVAQQADRKRTSDITE